MALECFRKDSELQFRYDVHRSSRPRQVPGPKPPKLGICEVCCGPPLPDTVYDHCHDHGWIRGEVCASHNSLLAVGYPEPWMAEHWKRCPECPPLEVIVNDPPNWLRDIGLCPRKGRPRSI